MRGWEVGTLSHYAKTCAVGSGQQAGLPLLLGSQVAFILIANGRAPERAATDLAGEMDEPVGSLAQTCVVVADRSGGAGLPAAWVRTEAGSRDRRRVLPFHPRGRARV